MSIGIVFYPKGTCRSTRCRTLLAPNQGRSPIFRPAPTTTQRDAHFKLPNATRASRPFRTCTTAASASASRLFT